ncbi:hypothetical protein A8926_4821 [Saccharopolyspora spinosa]|uniref:Uncharacterized protein n=1 Tax=Saccharopolyspora spinosa TaxID=60894 RepID=A0A2N3Y1W4_SACSN|nr:hypothetical protein A8926_4821 [Saccharopolyspora spinosa]
MRRDNGKTARSEQVCRKSGKVRTNGTNRPQRRDSDIKAHSRLPRESTKDSLAVRTGGSSTPARGGVNIVPDTPARPFSPRDPSATFRHVDGTGKLATNREASSRSATRTASSVVSTSVKPRQRGPAQAGGTAWPRFRAPVSEPDGGTSRGSCASAADRKPTIRQRRLRPGRALRSRCRAARTPRRSPARRRAPTGGAPGSIPCAGGRNESRSTTSCPRSATASATADPMDPAPPVPRIRTPEGKGGRHRPEALRPVAHAGVGGVEWEA